MAIFVVDGKPRHGKTAWVVSHIPDWLDEARAGDFKIFSNVKINMGTGALKRYAPWMVGDIWNKKDRENPRKLLFYWQNMDEWNLMSKGVIICDEATRYFNARHWQSLSQETEIKLQQHGKEDLDVWAITQHYTRLDTSLRVLAESFYRVERVWGLGSNSTVVSRVSEHQLEDLDRYEALIRQRAEKEDAGIEEPETISYEYLWIRGKIKKMYDTKAKVLPSRPMPLHHEERFCADPYCPKHGRYKGKPKVVHV